MNIKLVLLAALAALATVVFAGTPSVASGEILHPCWDVSKTASVHGTPVTSLTLSVGQTVTIDYEVVVTQHECTEHETPEASVDVKDTYAGTLAVHLDHPATYHYSRDVTVAHCGSFEVDNTAGLWDDSCSPAATANVHVTSTATGLHVDAGVLEDPLPAWACPIRRQLGPPGAAPAHRSS